MARSGFTNSFTQSVLRLLFGNVSYVPPSNWYIGVSTTLINADGTGITEPTDPSYARVVLNNNTATWEDIPADFGRRNLINIEWSPATVSWGTVTYMFIADSATGSNARCFAELTIPKVVGIDDVLRIDASQLQIKFVTTT